MSQFPALNGKQIIRVLESFGFYLDRIEGSHHMLVKRGHPLTVPVPVHGHKPIATMTFRSILKQAGLTREKFYRAYWSL